MQEEWPEDSIAVIHIQAAARSAVALERAAWRIRQQIRAADRVLLLERDCAIVLQASTLAGAEAVARRITPLLADVEHEQRSLAGETAQRLLRELQRQRPRVLQVRPPAAVSDLPADEIQGPEPTDGLPYLAFLSSYPSLRLLHLLPFELARHYRCVPIGAERGTLTLATWRRLDQTALAQLEAITQRNIFQVRCDPGVIADILRSWQQQQERYLFRRPAERAGDTTTNDSIEGEVL